MPGFPVHQQLPSLLKLMSIELVMPSNHLILCHPLLPLLQSFPASGSFPMSQFFTSGGQSTRVSASTSVQGTLNSLLQHHSSKASILHHSAFFIVQLSHPYMTTGKTIALTRQTFVGRVMYLLFNMLSRLVITFLPRSKRLNFMAVITIFSDFGTPQNKVCHCFLCFPIYLP